MTFLIWQIFLFLLLAVLLGFIIGWFLRGRFISPSHNFSETDGSKAELSKCEKRVEKLEEEITQLENQLDDAKASSASSTVSTRSSTSKKKTKTTSKDGSKKPVSSKTSSTKANKAVAAIPDNLREINGIGKVIETALNEVDITTFAQVAKLKTGDKELIAKKLKTFTDRIERDKWIEQAKALHKAKYGKNP